ncbi:hypothetical protein JOE53_000308 [Microbacterium laevaniformans]|uniref:hypothetical protein n=1 Tax=Microbacterium laevaniformans TaxID=36807 RepID=UPI001956C6BC|nr:hypothetical protein [Microbacterium laevaniformans]MBM7751588.1 hypothetical protein [Microbacterium laevaniformans]
MDSYERAPSLICAHDPDVLKHFGAELAALPVPLMVSRDAADLFDRRENVAFLRYQLRWRFAKHLGLSSHHGYTAMFWALQGAYLLGWQKAVIIGMDHNHSSAGAPSAYETTGQVDTNHFDPRYFPQGLSLRNPVLRGNEYSYALARAAWDRAGRDVVDCTIDGKCDIFRKSELAIELGR